MCVRVFFLYLHENMEDAWTAQKIGMVMAQLVQLPIKQSMCCSNITLSTNNGLCLPSFCLFSSFWLLLSSLHCSQPSFVCPFLAIFLEHIRPFHELPWSLISQEMHHVYHISQSSTCVLWDPRVSHYFY